MSVFERAKTVHALDCSAAVIGATTINIINFRLIRHIQTRFRKTETTMNRPRQNVLVTRTQVKTRHKQQTSHK
jgi:hypothetical protein